MNEKPQKCDPDGKEYLAHPIQYKCKNCGQFWLGNEKIPVCNCVEINTVFPTKDNIREEFVTKEWNEDTRNLKIKEVWRISNPLKSQIADWFIFRCVPREECEEKCLDQYAMGQSEGMGYGKNKLEELKAEVEDLFTDRINLHKGLYDKADTANEANEEAYVIAQIKDIEKHILSLISKHE